jgi:hypothetical protein
MRDERRVNDRTSASGVFKMGSTRDVTCEGGKPMRLRETYEVRLGSRKARKHRGSKRMGHSRPREHANEKGMGESGPRLPAFRRGQAGEHLYDESDAIAQVH